MPYVGTSVTARVLVKGEGDAALPAPATAAEKPTSAHGTCFAISDDGLVLTARHVVLEDSSLFLTFEGRAPVPARVLRESREDDLALLKVDHATPDWLPLANSSVATPGDHLFTFGFPVPELLGRTPKFTDGSLSALEGIGSEVRLMQVTIPIQPGNSGGPVVTEDGVAIGVLTSTAAAIPFLKATGAIPQGIHWAVKAELAFPLLPRPNPASPRPQDRKESIRRVRGAVCAVQSVAKTKK